METFEDIWKEYYRPLIAYTRNIVRQDDVAEDIVTESFLKLYHASNRSKPTSFLFTCCKHAAFDYLRAEKIHDRIESEIEMELLSPCEDLGYDEMYYIYLNHLYKAINSLSPGQREIFIRKYRNEEPTKQIAQELGISEQTVRNQKIKAIEHLKHFFAIHQP